MANSLIAEGAVGTLTTQEHNRPAVADAVEPSERFLWGLAALAELVALHRDDARFLESAGAIIAASLDMEHFAAVRFDDTRRRTMVTIGRPASELLARGASSCDETDNGGTDEMDSFVDETELEKYETSADIMESAWAYALNQECATILVGPDQENRFEDPLLEQFQVESGVVCPLTVSRHVSQRAVLGVFSDKRKQVEMRDLQFMVTATRLISSAYESMHLEDTLDRHERFVSRTFDSMQAPVLITDANGDIVATNETLRRLMVPADTELVGRPVDVLFASETTAEEFEAAARSALFSEEVINLETEFRSKSGARLRIAWTFTALSTSWTVVATGVNKTREHAMITRLGNSQNLAAFAPGMVSVPKSTRDSHRRPYRVVQRIAPYADGMIPARSQFYEIRCRDISTSGFSFIHQGSPGFKKLIVMLRTGAEILALVAEVVHITPRANVDECIVGCQFVKRTELPP